MTAFRESQISHHYQFKDEMSRRTAPMRNTKGIESDEPDLKFGEDVLVYLRPIDRQVQNEMVEQNRRGDAETYGHTRKPQKGADTMTRGE